MSRLRMILLGAIGLVFAIFGGAWCLSYARPVYTIEHLQQLPPSMQPAFVGPAGTWYGSQRRYVFLANGKFVGEVGNWWDVVPQPTNPRSLAGRGANSGIRDSAVPVLRAVPGAFLGSGVSAGTVMEWVLPLWQPTVLAGAAVLALLWPELILLLAFRSRHRRRLGRCVKCGYDRAGLAAGAACPECGEHMAKLPKGQIAKWE